MQASIFSLFAGLILTATAAGPSDDMFAELKSAPSSFEAESAAEDISAAFNESGSPTADLLLERAMTAIAAKEFTEAREFLDRAIAVQPEFPEAWYQRALIFLNEGLYDQAIYDLNEALSSEPRHFEAWLTLGLVFEQMGQSREALEAFREVLKIHPFHEVAGSEVRRLTPLVDGRAI